jgi:hypothetical protein
MFINYYSTPDKSIHLINWKDDTSGILWIPRDSINNPEEQLKYLVSQGYGQEGFKTIPDKDNSIFDDYSAYPLNKIRS